MAGTSSRAPAGTTSTSSTACGPGGARADPFMMPLRVPIPVSQELLAPWLRLTATLRALEATPSALPLTQSPIRSSLPALFGARSPLLAASPLALAALSGDGGLSYASRVSLRPSLAARNGGCARVSVPARALSPVVIPPAALQVAMRAAEGAVTARDGDRGSHNGSRDPHDEAGDQDGEALAASRGNGRRDAGGPRKGGGTRGGGTALEREPQLGAHGVGVERRRARPAGGRAGGFEIEIRQGADRRIVQKGPAGREPAGPERIEARSGGT